MDSQQPGQFNPQQYDFIMNNQQPKRSFLPGAGSSKRQRILIVAIGAMVLLIVLIMIFSAIFGGNGGSKQRLTDVAKTQTELARVAAIGTDTARSTDARSLAMSVQLSLTSDKAIIISQIKENGDKVNEKELVKGKNTETDEKLTAAEQNGTFDVVFTSTMREMLEDYQAQLKATFEATSGNATRQTLSNAYENAGVLLENTQTN